MSGLNPDWALIVRAEDAEAEVLRLRILIEKILDYSSYPHASINAFRIEAGLESLDE